MIQSQANLDAKDRYFLEEVEKELKQLEDLGGGGYLELLLKYATDQADVQEANKMIMFIIIKGFCMTAPYSFLDRILITIDDGLKTLFADPIPSRLNPSDSQETTLNEQEQKKSGALMRINHVGEVCAQALYRGQAMTAKKENVALLMQKAAEEEVDHLAWCQKRLDELEAHPSYLNPLWYLGAFTFGLTAGCLGDKWSLGFIVETERQVEKHLLQHLDLLPPQDFKSRAIVQQMCEDEAQHATLAEVNGAAELPQPIKSLMRLFSTAMTKTAYWI